MFDRPSRREALAAANGHNPVAERRSRLALILGGIVLMGIVVVMLVRG